MCSIARMRGKIGVPGFLERVFVEEELEYAMGRHDPAQSLAASFAAREAVAKAFGIGLARMGFKGAWVRRTSSGPVVCLDDKMVKYGEGIGLRSVHLSITHEGGMALAFVVLEGDG